MLESRSLLAALALAGCGQRAGSEAQPVADFALVAYVDDNGNGLAADDPPRTVRLSDYFAANRPGTAIIMLNAAAGWCSPCMTEAAALSAFAGAYADRGVVVLTAVIQDSTGMPSSGAFARLWAETFEIGVPTLVDEEFVTAAYFDLGVMPANLFVDAQTETVLEVAVGTASVEDPMREYRDLLDYYLAR